MTVKCNSYVQEHAMVLSLDAEIDFSMAVSNTAVRDGL